MLGNQNILENNIRIRENKHKDRNLVEKHYHQIHQILYVLENSGEIILNDQVHPFTQDCLAFITPYSPHSITSDTKMTVLVLEFEMSDFGNDMKKLLYQHHFDETRLINMNLFTAGNVRQLLRRMLYEQSQGKAINQMSMKICLSELLLILLRNKKEPSITNANTFRAERLRKYMDTHYFEVTNATELSQKIGISTRHVNTIFKEQYNTTPMKYLNEVRMEVAKKLLVETDNDIPSICFEIGFESLATFYRRFKEFTGVSPNKFRLENKFSS